MKILIASAFLPEIKGTGAGSRFVGEILRELSNIHEIHLVSRVETGKEDEVEDIRPFCKSIRLFKYPSLQKRRLIEILRLLLSHLIFSYKLNKIISSGHFDFVQVEWVESGIFLARQDIPMMLDAHDVITKVAERWFKRSRGLISLIQYIRYVIMKNLEKYVIRKFDKILVRSEYDKTYLLKINPQLSVDVLVHPAGLDFIGCDTQRDDKSLLFLGSFKDHASNVKAVLYFYNEVLPLVRLKIPDIKFYVVGYGPTKDILEIARRDNNVIVTGYVDNIEHYYKRVKVFIAPMLTGGGVIVKILDAMMAGTPVVSTTIGNEGIGGIDNVHLLIADDPRIFADKIIRLLSDDGLWLKLSREGHAFVSQKFSMENMKSVLSRIYGEISINAKEKAGNL